MVRSYYFLFIFVYSALAMGCVGAQKYQAEIAARHASEARAQVLSEQLERRSAEFEKILNELGAQQRRNGEQSALIQIKERDLAVKIEKQGEISAKLLEEKMLLERQLSAQTAERERCASTLEQFIGTQKQRKAILDSLIMVLTPLLPDSKDLIYQIEIRDEAAAIVFAEKGLFDPASLVVSPAGKILLAPIAEWLSANPEIRVEVRAHTDNQLPRSFKTVTDTWEWSQRRAAAVVRLFFRDFNLNPNQFMAVGAGEYFPIESNETSEGREKNRRTELLIFPVLTKWPEP